VRQGALVRCPATGAWIPLPEKARERAAGSLPPASRGRRRAEEEGAGEESAGGREALGKRGVWRWEAGRKV